MRAIVVAGGTGGHIYPALAIINKIKEKEKNSEILYIGTTDRMEKDIVPKLGIAYIGLEVVGLNRKNLFKNVEVFNKYKKAVNDAKKEISKFKPDIVIGVGGYITLPVLTAAKKLGYKTLIHEQNSIPGLSNKMLAKKASCVCVSLPNSVRLFKNKNVFYTGNPRSEEIIDVPTAYRDSLGFSRSKKLVIIVMGSLGSSTVTKKLKEMIPEFKNKNYQVLVVTGNNYFQEYKDVAVPTNVKLVPFLNNLINLMKDTDLIVSRAGASTIAEITAIGLPAILVPSPYVTHNHQYMNAKELADLGACSILEEKDFSSENLIKEIDSILENEQAYAAMKKASKKLGVSDSATKIYECIKKTIG